MAADKRILVTYVMFLGQCKETVSRLIKRSQSDSEVAEYV